MSDDADNPELDVRLMEWMSDDQLERYTRILERLETTRAEFDAAMEVWRDYDKEQGRATTEWHPAKHRAFETEAAWSEALDAKIAMMKDITKVVGRNVQAWEALAKMALTVMGELVDGGKLPANCGGAGAYWRLIYGRILTEWGDGLRRNPIFRHVRIMEFLTTMLVNRLPNYAEDARQKGNVILAQVMEELAER